MSVGTAMLVHDCTLTMMITGHSLPPARLHTLKTAKHPSFAGCADPNCIIKRIGPCNGNRCVCALCARVRLVCIQSLCVCGLVYVLYHVGKYGHRSW